MKFNLFNTNTQDFGTNGVLKRSIALSVFKSNNMYVIVLYVINLGMFVINGLKWINIPTETLCMVFTTSYAIIQTLQNERQTIVNYYFQRDKEELEDGIKISQTENKR